MVSSNFPQFIVKAYGPFSSFPPKVHKERIILTALFILKNGDRTPLAFIFVPERLSKSLVNVPSIVIPIDWPIAYPFLTIVLPLSESMSSTFSKKSHSCQYINQSVGGLPSSLIEPKLDHSRPLDF